MSDGILKAVQARLVIASEVLTNQELKEGESYALGADILIVGGGW